MFTRTCRQHSSVLDALTIELAISASGVRESRSVTTSMPRKNPAAAYISDVIVIDGQWPDACFQQCAHLSTFWMSAHSSISFSTADPTAPWTGLPANVLMYCVRCTELLNQLRSRHTRCDRVPVTHWLAGRDDVGHDSHLLIAPPCSGAAETRLDLIKDHESASGPHQFGGTSEEVDRDVGKPLVPRKSGQNSMPANATPSMSKSAIAACTSPRLTGGGARPR